MALHATTGVDQFLLASEVRMALIAQFNAEIASLGTTRGECIATRANDVGVYVLGMNVGLHGSPEFLAVG